MKSDYSSSYWDMYYTSFAGVKAPTQFAAFILNKFSERTHFLDCGCGNGRDAFFFAEHGKVVVAIDASKVVIEKNRCEAKKKLELAIDFECIDFSKKEKLQKFTRRHTSIRNGCVIYARFFLHAIEEEAEKNFFDFCRNFIDLKGVICLEFRTRGDMCLPKETAPHYRRFIDTKKLYKRINHLGMEIEYYTEGRGYAKYESDDAYVARMIISRK